MAGLDLAPILEACLNLQDNLADETLSKEERIAIIQQHIVLVENHHTIKIPDFKPGLEWINTSAPLSLHNHLKGKVVIMDFFTYCCVNCLHLLPALAALEKKYTSQDGLVVIGVHSAKFDNERVLDNVISAVLRYGIHHPVINDSNGLMWDNLGINCWPTLLILGPENQALVMLLGERHSSDLEVYVEAAMKHYIATDKLLPHSIPLRLLHETTSTKENLLFPGKICINEAGDLMALSDTGHHRILIISVDGSVQECVGSLNPGFQDGNFEHAKFCSPQGVSWVDSTTIYVADTGNHSIRQINTATRQVLTVAGVGVQGNDKSGGELGINQPLNSPWDICVGSSLDSNDNDVLFIAMAGHHQIWALFLKDGNWLKNISYTSYTCVCVAGNGIEENRNNAYPLRAGFAQPSGIVYFRIGQQPYLAVADSESSSIRIMSLSDGSIKALAGGEKDPKNLFAFGDVDGIGVQAKLQHPLGVAWNAQESLLYVADSYNHKIKVIDPSTRKCTTFAKKIDCDTQNQQNCVPLSLNEPGGLCLNPSASVLYIADTNNHVIKTVDLEKGVAKEISLSWCSQHIVKASTTAVDGILKTLRPKPHDTIKLNSVALQHKGRITFKMNISLDGNMKLTPDAPQMWRMFVTGTDILSLENKAGKILSLSDQPQILVVAKSAEDSIHDIASVELEVTLYFCSLDEDRCYSRNLLFQVPVIVCSDGSQEETVELRHTVK